MLNSSRLTSCITFMEITYHFIHMHIKSAKGCRRKNKILLSDCHHNKCFGKGKDLFLLMIKVKLDIKTTELISFQIISNKEKEKVTGALLIILFKGFVWTQVRLLFSGFCMRT